MAFALVSIPSATRGSFSCKQLSGDYFIHLPNLASAPPPSIPPSGAQTALNLSGEGEDLHIPSWAIALLPHSLGIKATICLCKTLYLFPSTHPSVHTFIVWRPHACLSFALWAPPYTCDILTVQLHPVTNEHWVASTRVPMYGIYASFIHACVERLNRFGKQSDVTAWVICDCSVGRKHRG